MKVLTHTVKGGFGLAGRNFAPVMGVVEEPTGLAPLVRGTLSLTPAGPANKSIDTDVLSAGFAAYSSPDISNVGALAAWC